MYVSRFCGMFAIGKQDLCLLCQVFPGGNFDATQDQDDLRMTAIRETFEETGVLLASPSATDRKSPSEAQLDKAREQIHAQKELFRGFLLRWGLTPELDSLVQFTKWTTPPNQPR
jgi:8-oxo-dGTP pyrophosphatase MutT (NUDIX family)